MHPKSTEQEHRFEIK